MLVRVTDEDIHYKIHIWIQYDLIKCNNMVIYGQTKFFTPKVESVLNQVGLL